MICDSFYAVILGFLLKFYARYIGSEMGQSALDMVLVCLRAMNNGGIHDHIGQVRRIASEVELQLTGSLI